MYRILHKSLFTNICENVIENVSALAETFADAADDLREQMLQLGNLKEIDVSRVRRPGAQQIPKILHHDVVTCDLFEGASDTVAGAPSLRCP